MRKSHAEEYAEQQRKKAERAARKAEEKAQKLETKKLEKLAAEEDKRKKAERDAKRFEDARVLYQQGWSALLASADHPTQLQGVDGELGFSDIPWPVAAAYRHRHPSRKLTVAELNLEDLSEEAISAFLSPEAQDRRDRLREAILRFHPDKFEGRIIKRIQCKDQDKSRDAARIVTGILNSLLNKIQQ